MLVEPDQSSERHDHTRPSRPAGPVSGPGSVFRERRIPREQNQSSSTAQIEIIGYLPSDEPLLQMRAELLLTDRHDYRSVEGEASLPKHESREHEETPNKSWHAVRRVGSFLTRG